jgi:hypothetical protein
VTVDGQSHMFICSLILWFVWCFPRFELGEIVCLQYAVKDKSMDYVVNVRVSR